MQLGTTGTSSEVNVHSLTQGRQPRRSSFRRLTPSATSPPRSTSVFAQTFTDYEVIVSTMDRPTTWRRRSIRFSTALIYIEQPIAGAAAARNAGIH